MSLTLFPFIRTYILKALDDNYILAIPISIFITFVIQTCIEVILNWFKDACKPVDKIELDKIKLDNVFYGGSRVMSKEKGLYHKVPSNLWISLKDAKDNCIIKNYNSELSKNNLKIRYNNYEKYIQISLKIIGYF